MQDWELLTKSYNDISNVVINDTDFLRLKLHILPLGYLEEGTYYFIKLPTEVVENKDNLELQVSDLEEEKIKQKMLWEEKKESWVAACLATFCPSARGSPKSEFFAAVLDPSGSSISAPPPPPFALSAPSGFSAPLLSPSAPSAPSSSTTFTPPPSASSTPSAPSTLFTSSTLSALSTLSAPFAPSAPSALST